MPAAAIKRGFEAPGRDYTSEPEGNHKLQPEGGQAALWCLPRKFVMLYGSYKTEEIHAS